MRLLALVDKLAMLREIGRITPRPEPIVADLGQRLGVVVCDAAFRVVAETAANVAWTRDPFDRIIVAQASLGGYRLITKDETIRKRYRPAIW